MDGIGERGQGNGLKVPTDMRADLVKLVLRRRLKLVKHQYTKLVSLQQAQRRDAPALMQESSRCVL